MQKLHNFLDIFRCHSLFAFAIVSVVQGTSKISAVQPCRNLPHMATRDLNLATYIQKLISCSKYTANISNYETATTAKP
jgi:hypothetical protein